MKIKNTFIAVLLRMSCVKLKLFCYLIIHQKPIQGKKEALNFLIKILKVKAVISKKSFHLHFSTVSPPILTLLQLLDLNLPPEQLIKEKLTIIKRAVKNILRVFIFTIFSN